MNSSVKDLFSVGISTKVSVKAAITGEGLASGPAEERSPAATTTNTSNITKRKGPTGSQRRRWRRKRLQKLTEQKKLALKETAIKKKNLSQLVECIRGVMQRDVSAIDSLNKLDLISYNNPLNTDKGLRTNYTANLKFSAGNVTAAGVNTQFFVVGSSSAASKITEEIDPPPRPPKFHVPSIQGNLSNKEVTSDFKSKELNTSTGSASVYRGNRYPVTKGPNSPPPPPPPPTFLVPSVKRGMSNQHATPIYKSKEAITPIYLAQIDKGNSACCTSDPTPPPPPKFSMPNVRTGTPNREATPARKMKMSTPIDFDQVDRGNNSFIKVAVVDTGFPGGKILGERQAIFQNALDAAFDAAFRTSKNSLPVRFDWSGFKGDKFMANCEDRFTVGFLKEQVRKLGNLWDGISLKVVEENEIPRFRVAVSIKGSLRSTEEILSCLKKQNGLNTELWEVYHLEEKEDKLFFVFGIDHESFEWLKNRNGLANFRLTRLQFRPQTSSGLE